MASERLGGWPRGRGRATGGEGPTADPPVCRHPSRAPLPREQRSHDRLIHRLPHRQGGRTAQRAVAAGFIHCGLAGGTEVEIVSWLDDHSRLALSVTADPVTDSQVTLDTFRAAVAAHGPPTSPPLTTGPPAPPGSSAAALAATAWKRHRLGATQKNGPPSHPNQAVHRLTAVLDEPASDVEDIAFAVLADEGGTAGPHLHGWDQRRHRARLSTCERSATTEPPRDLARRMQGNSGASAASRCRPAQSRSADGLTPAPGRR